jgi:hypothetical protein
MKTLSTVDPAAPIECTLPVTEAAGRLSDLDDVVGGGRLQGIARLAGRFRFTIARDGRDDLEDQLAAWAADEKSCCAFLGFGIESAKESVTMEIRAPDGAEPTLDGIDWLVRAAAGRKPSA